MPTDLAEGSLVSQNINRMLAAGASCSEAFQMQMSRAAADDNAFVMASRRDADVDARLITFVGSQAMFGSNGTLQNEILAARSAGGQPQSGGGPGQPVVFPVQQQLPNTNQAGAPPNIVIFNPTTGTVSKI